MTNIIDTARTIIDAHVGKRVTVCIGGATKSFSVGGELKSTGAGGATQYYVWVNGNTNCEFRIGDVSRIRTNDAGRLCITIK